MQAGYRHQMIGAGINQHLPLPGANPGAFTHTSVAIRDALLAVAVPTIEVHLSNIQAREDFRRSSLISDIVTGTVSGLGAPGVFLAFEALLDLVDRR